jgi:hypothetical protein
MVVRGDKVMWDRVEVDPRFQFKTETSVSKWLEIDPTSIEKATHVGADELMDKALLLR